MPRVFIIANGEPDFPNKFISMVTPSDIIICADGGINHALRLGMKPQLVVGDMDSANPELLISNKLRDTRVLRYPKDKDASDLELALKAAMEYAPSEIFCAAVLGKRQDHSLTNTFLIGRFASLGIKISLLGSTWKAQFVTSDQPCTFTGSPGDIFSIIPMVATVSGVTVSGVKWPLNNEHLPWGSSRTVSNEFLDKQVGVHLRDGLLLAFHYKPN